MPDVSVTDGHAFVTFAISVVFCTFFRNSSTSDGLFGYPSSQRIFENLVERRFVNLVVDLPDVVRSSSRKVVMLYDENNKENIMEILIQNYHSSVDVLVGICLVLQCYANQADT